MRLPRAILAIAVVVTPALARAKTLHVSPSGDDQGDGTSSAPFLTIQKAVESVAPGDEVVVAAGTYAGFTLEDLHATEAAPIVIRGEAGTIIDSPGPTPLTPPVNSATGDTSWPAWPAGVTVLRSSHVAVEGFEVRGMPGPVTVNGQLAHKGGMGFRLEACRHVTLRHNVADQNGRWGIFSSFCDDLVIEHNETSRSGLEHGIYLSNSGDRPVLRHNHSWGNALCGIQLNSDNNWHDDAYEAFATVDGTISGALLEGNILVDNGESGGAAINFDGVQDSRIQNNLLVDNHASGIALYQHDGREGARRNVVVNNTIVMAADARYAIVMLDCVAIDSQGACTTANMPFLPSWAKPTAYATGSTGNTVLNNVVYHASSSQKGDIDTDASSLAVDDVSGAAMRSDYNAFTGRFAIDGDAVDLAEWRAVTGGDDHSFTSDPTSLLVAPGQGDFGASGYGPRPDGGAVDAGTTDEAPSTDLAGIARPSGAGVDIGAYEHCPDVSCESAAEGGGGSGSEGGAPGTGSGGASHQGASGGQEASADLPRGELSAGGCGCRFARGTPAEASLFFAAAALAVGLRRRASRPSDRRKHRP